MGTLSGPGNFRHYRSCALVLLGVLGIFAFVVSAISPHDDDYQHEYIRGGKPLRIVVAWSAKAASAKCTGHDIQALERAIGPHLLQPKTAALPRVKEAFWLEKFQLPSRADRAPPTS
jgi:hypothetical protein